MKYPRLFSCIALFLFCAGICRGADAQAEFLSKINFAIRGHDARAFYECVNFTGADEIMTKDFVTLSKGIVNGPPQPGQKVEIVITPLENVVPGKDEMEMLNGHCTSLVTVAGMRFCAGVVNGKFVILLPLKLQPGRRVEGKPGLALSPYNRNGHAVDIKGLAQGTLITDGPGDRPFLAPAASVLGGAVEPESEITFEADPGFSLRPYYTKEHLKPLRVDKRDAAGKPVEIRIYRRDDLLIFAPDGQLRDMRPYVKEDFFTDAEWKLQSPADGAKSE